MVLLLPVFSFACSTPCAERVKCAFLKAVSGSSTSSSDQLHCCRWSRGIPKSHVADQRLEDSSICTPCSALFAVHGLLIEFLAWFCSYSIELCFRFGGKRMLGIRHNVTTA